MGKTNLEILSAKYPALKELIKRLDCIPVSPRKNTYDKPRSLNSANTDVSATSLSIPKRSS